MPCRRLYLCDENIVHQGQDYESKSQAVRRLKNLDCHISFYYAIPVSIWPGIVGIPVVSKNIYSHYCISALDDVCGRPASRNTHPQHFSAHQNRQAIGKR